VTFTRKMLVGCGAVVLLIVMLFCLMRNASAPSSPRIVASFAGVTNGTVGITNGRWATYVVTNTTSNSFSIVGAKIEIEGSNGWQLDPTLRATEGGTWWPLPTRGWHDSKDGRLGVGASFHYFVRLPDDPVPWKATISFLEDRRARMRPPSTAIPRILMEDALDWLDSLRYPHINYDCQLPDVAK
jgi:hypothetical protein